MDLTDFRGRLKELRMAGKELTLRDVVEAVHRVEVEMIRAALRGWPPSDGRDGDRSAHVPCPKRPRPTLNRSAVALPLEFDSGDGDGK